MKKGFPFLLLSVFIISCKTTSYTPPAQKLSRQEYISQYAPVAIAEMNRTGIPASIKLAQAILESGDGNSTLARRANNHFGIKCHDWTGPRMYHDDDRRGECFRKYRTPDESFRDHSDFLTGRARYAFLFDIETTDYKAWASGLKKAGYATNPSYDRLLIRIIEENQLAQYDKPGYARNNVTQSSGSANTTVVNTTVRITDTRNHIKYIVVKEGDTFASLTRELNLMQWELPRFNETSAKRDLIPGEIIYLQPKRNRAERGSEIHTAEQGETMYKISQLYGVKVDRLLRMNNMVKGDEPLAGDQIWLRANKPEKDIEKEAPKIEYEL
jgi:LysM repeat protein